jgi:hypothetical protein
MFGLGPGLFYCEQSKSEFCFIFLHQFLFRRIYPPDLKNIQNEAIT